MTTLMDNFCNVTETDMLHNDETTNRTKDFAQRHVSDCPDFSDDEKDTLKNRIEAMGFFYTVVDANDASKSTKFGTHIDQFNDHVKQGNWHGVFVVHEHVEIDGILCRFSFVAYSRQALRSC